MAHGRPIKAPYMKKKVAERPPHGEKDLHKEKNIVKEAHHIAILFFRLSRWATAYSRPSPSLKFGSARDY